MVNRIVQKAIDAGVITSSEQDVYHYAYTLLFGKIGIFFLFGVMGAITGYFWESIVFLLTYTPLREYSGGPHVKSVGLCFVVSIVMFSVTLLPPLLVSSRQLWWVVSLLLPIYSILIYVFAPQADPNKPMTIREKKHCGKMARATLFVILGAIGLLWFLKVSYIWLYFLSAGIVLTGILVTIKAAQNHFREQKYSN